MTYGWSLGAEVVEERLKLGLNPAVEFVDLRLRRLRHGLLFDLDPAPEAVPEARRHREVGDGTDRQAPRHRQADGEHVRADERMQMQGLGDVARSCTEL